MRNQSTMRKHNKLSQIYANFIAQLLYRVHLTLDGNKIQSVSYDMQ